MKQIIVLTCSQFAESLHAGNGPRIEDFLHDPPGEHRGELFCELLAIELEYRRNHRQTVDLDEYLARFNEYGELVHEIFSRPFAPTLNSSIESIAVALTAGLEERPSSDISPLETLPASALQPHIHLQEFSPGEPLMRQGESGNSLMVIRDGQVEISIVDQDGNTHVLDQAGRGQVLGEMSLLTAEPRSASAVALDCVLVAVLPADSFHQLARQYPRLSVVLSELVAKRLGRGGRDALTDKLLDRYRIKGRLGRGAMSVVYEAEDSASGECFALKMMSHRLVYSPRALQRFQAEADIIESFDHPGIVRTFGRFAAFHTYFIVMEYCPGQSLDQLIGHRELFTEAKFRRAMGQLAAAVMYAHRADVLHRDIKPANIMLTAEGQLKLMDFGLARPVAELHADFGQMVGTPRYMAPEQRAGKQFGKAADLFALGCTAYEMLVGQPLFDGNTLQELLRPFDVWQPPDLKDLRDDLSVETCRLLQPALNPDPQQRQLDLAEIAKWAE